MNPTRRVSAVVSLVLGAVLLCSVAPASAQNKLEPYYRPLKPDGAGPFPALMLLPGCGGVASAQVKRAEALKAQGYFIVMVDFVAARGLPTMCAKVAQYFREIATQDIRDTLAYLKAQPFVDPSAIGALGWSTGGGAIIYALAAAQADQPPLRAAVMFYPICRGLRPWKVNTPGLMLLGSLDDVNLPKYCQDLAKDLPAGTSLEVRTYEGARHVFDDHSLGSVVPFLGTMTVGYHREAATQAWDEAMKFLAARLKSKNN
jgi:dienelactone hydrolase